MIKMASFKYRPKGFLRKKLNSQHTMTNSSLRTENAYLRRTLDEMSHQHSALHKLVEICLSLETVRPEIYQQVTAKEAKLTGIQSTSDEGALTNNITELQHQLSDALEKNKQWLEYDQQREAYVRAILARMLWLEMRLNEANQARSLQQHNEDHSDEKELMRQMQEHYENLLQKAKDKLEKLSEQNAIINQNLITSQNWGKSKEREVEELKQQLQTEKNSRKGTVEDHHCSEDEEQQLCNARKDLRRKRDEEKRRSDDFELQMQIMLSRDLADREMIEDLQRQVTISSQDLEDERQNCSYLKKQMVRVLKMLQKNKGCVTQQSEKDQQDCSSGEAAQPPSLPSRDGQTSSPYREVLNESFLECPSCQAEYPANHYRELMNHLETCLD